MRILLFVAMFFFSSTASAAMEKILIEKGPYQVLISIFESPFPQSCDLIVEILDSDSFVLRDSPSQSATLVVGSDYILSWPRWGEEPLDVTLWCVGPNKLVPLGKGEPFEVSDSNE